MVPPAIETAAIGYGSLEHSAEATITTGKNSFEKGELGVMPLQPQAFLFQCVSQLVLTRNRFVITDLRFPLKGGVRLGNEC